MQFVMLDNLALKSLSMPTHLTLPLSQEEAVLPTWETVAQLQLQKLMLASQFNQPPDDKFQM